MNTPHLLDKVRLALESKSPKDIARIAVMVDVTAETVRNIRDGATDPRFSTVHALALHLGVFDAALLPKDKRAKRSPSAAAA